MVLKLKENFEAVNSANNLIYHNQENNIWQQELINNNYSMVLNNKANNQHYMDYTGYHDTCGMYDNNDSPVEENVQGNQINRFRYPSFVGIIANCTKTNSWQKDNWTRNQLTPNFLSGGTTILWNNYYSHNEASFGYTYEGGSEALYPIFYSGGISRDLKTILNFPANAWWASLGQQGKLSNFNQPTYSYTRATTWFYQAFQGDNDRYHRYYLAFVHRNNGNFLTSESWYPYVWEIHYDYYASIQPSLEPLSGFSSKLSSTKIDASLSPAQPFYMDNYGVWTWDKASGVPKMKTWKQLDA